MSRADFGKALERESPRQVEIEFDGTEMSRLTFRLSSGRELVARYPPPSGGDAIEFFETEDGL